MAHIQEKPAHEMCDIDVEKIKLYRIDCNEKMNDDPYLLDNRTQSSVVKGTRQEITYGKKKQQHKTRTRAKNNNRK